MSIPKSTDYLNEMCSVPTMTERPRPVRIAAWIEGLQNKRCTADEAVKAIRSGDCVYIHPGAAEPEQLVRAMVRRAPDLRDVTVIHLLTGGSADYVRPEMAGKFRHVAFFAGSNVREAINEGRAD